jgi:hypothetical protein
MALAVLLLSSTRRYELSSYAEGTAVYKSSPPSASEAVCKVDSSAKQRSGEAERRCGEEMRRSGPLRGVLIFDFI